MGQNTEESQTPPYKRYPVQRRDGSVTHPPQRCNYTQIPFTPNQKPLCIQWVRGGEFYILLGGRYLVIKEPFVVQIGQITVGLHAINRGAKGGY